MTAYDQNPRDAFDPYTNLECQECADGYMNIVETDGLGNDTEYVVECDSCGWSAHATFSQVDSGYW